MSDFSRAPAEVLREAKQSGYSGLHIEQGVPILDRDLNLMHDLLASGIQSALSRYIGDGAPEVTNDAFAIRALPDGRNENNFQIVGPGSCLVNGIEATIEKSVEYGAQPHVEALESDHPSRPKSLTTASAADPDPRVDIVFLDVFTKEVAGTPDLDNGFDVGMQTSVRIKALWTVRVAENAAAMPAPQDGHAYYPLARLLRRGGETKIVDGPLADNRPEQRFTDLRQRRLTVAKLEARLSLLEQMLFAPSFTQDPNVGQIRPRQGRVNQPITLSGKNFAKGKISVTFGTVPAQAADSPPPTDTEITYKVPSGITPDGVSREVKIKVSSDIGFSAVSDRTFLVSAAPVFAEPPRSQFTPTSGPSGTIVTLAGFNFTPGQPTVTFGGRSASVQPNATATELKVAVPDGLTPNSDVKIKVAFPDPRGSSETTATFKVLAN
jgi:hypothetical protein